MFHIVYASSATEPFSESALKTLLEKARLRNQTLGLTGMLLYKDGNFMQTLEGEEEAVTKLLASIAKDPRHKGVLVLLRRTSKERIFPDWTMGYRNLADPDFSKMPGLTDFMNTPLTGTEFSGDPDRCMKLMLLFKKNM